jgi:phosphopantothenoylcysteine decarboxylase/phosphopantothenate--cysteine ligase
MSTPAPRRILLIISGGIAGYKSLELIRRLRKRDHHVRCVLTHAATQLVSPLAVAALSEEKVSTELFSLTDEAEMGHIQLSRWADLVVVAPATANLLAKMAHGLADDLASTLLLATDTPILLAPAMNVLMWRHPATQANVATLEARGVLRVGPDAGDLACGEAGEGRMADPTQMLTAIETYLDQPSGPLVGLRALVTSGPTHEPIDPVRYIGNRSSGKQGHAVAAALAAVGAETVLVTGPTALNHPQGCEVQHVETAEEMRAACEAALPVDIAVCAAAVADWRIATPAADKIKKDGSGPPVLELAENPDILAALSQHSSHRPRLVIGFAAETERLVDHARSKLQQKGCDWIVANDVSPQAGTFGSEHNTICLVTGAGEEAWPELSKQDVAARLVRRIAEELGQRD